MTRRETREQPTLLRETEVARLLGMSPRTLQGWRLRGSGPPYIRIGRSVRYRQSDLKSYIER